MSLASIPWNYLVSLCPQRENGTIHARSQDCHLREISFFHPIRYCVRAQIATQTDGSHLHLNQLPFHRQMVFESDKGVEKILTETDQSSAEWKRKWERSVSAIWLTRDESIGSAWQSAVSRSFKATILSQYGVKLEWDRQIFTQFLTRFDCCGHRG